MNNLRTRFQSCCASAVIAFLLVIFASYAKPVLADLPIVLKDIQNTPATLFDIGMKQLRHQVLNAAVRLSSKSGPSPSARVWMSKENGTIEILYLYSVTPDAVITPTADSCSRLRATALKQIFRIGKTVYDVELSDEARIARRLGSYFVGEPVRGSKEAIAMGQRLSELTNLEVRIADDTSNTSFSCRAPVNRIVSE